MARFAHCLRNNKQYHCTLSTKKLVEDKQCTELHNMVPHIVRGVKRLGFFTYPLGPPPRNVLLYGPIQSIIFILQNFEVLPPVRGV